MKAKDSAFARAEVTLRKCAPGTGFQVTLEAARFSFRRKFNGYGNGPWAMRNGVAAGAIIVPVQSLFRVARNADVMPFGVSIAPQDVHEPLLCFVHAMRQASFGPARTARESLWERVI